jgi:hypothetical protein
MMTLSRLLFACTSFLVLNGTVLNAQNHDREIIHKITFKPQFLQIKDEFNYGLVHNGLNLAGEYSRAVSTASRLWTYSAELGVGAVYRQGVGMNWSLKPADLSYGFRLTRDSKAHAYLGPYALAVYKWQLYPELQSGHMFWFSSYELGPQLQISVPLEEKLLDFKFSFSLASFNSRPEAVTEQYYYSLTFADFVKNPHSNMKLGSLNQYGHIRFMAQLSNPGKNPALAYEFEYLSYRQAPEFKYMSHSIIFKWKLGNK